MKGQPFLKLTTFLMQLDQANIHYMLASHRDDTNTVLASVPGERWEIKFLGDGFVEVERSISNGEICGEEALHELLTRHADQEHVEAV